MAAGPCDVTLSSLENLRQRIDEQLAAHAQYPAGCPQRLEEAIRYCLLAPGKRLRPVMVLLAHEACGGNVSDALGAACAVEMIHTYSLVHDDLPAMDDDDLRRGRPTCHRQFDEATAILVGDALLTQAFEILAAEVHPAETAVRCIKVLATAAGACHLIGGQSADLAAENEVLTIDELVAVHVRKTAALFSAAAYLGGATAGADAETTGRLSEFGRLIGLSFQIIDDLLDVRGTPGDVGKMTQKDRVRGKATYPQLLGEVTSQACAEELVGQALALLEPLGAPAAGLRNLVQQMVHRNK